VAGDWLQAVRQVVAAVRASDVTELEVANGDFSVRVRRDPEASLLLGEGVRVPLAEEEDSRLHRVVAPFTGVFYRSPTPDAGAYVSEGDWVDVDGMIGLVETMKIFNEVTADVAGRIKKIVADNFQLVHTGDTLVLLEPGERATAEPEPRL
jgi:biotin carboxyl carrier protein